MSNGVNPCLKWSSSKSSRIISSKQEKINYTFMLRESFFSLSRCNYVIRRHQSKCSHYGSRSHFHPGPPSNVYTVLYNGAAPKNTILVIQTHYHHHHYH